MIVFGNLISADKMAINRVFYDPSILSEEDKAGGIEVDYLLEGPTMKGKNIKNFINPQTLQQWVEYEDRPLTVEEIKDIELHELKHEVAMLWYEIMMLGGM